MVAIDTIVGLNDFMGLPVYGHIPEKGTVYNIFTRVFDSSQQSAEFLQYQGQLKGLFSSIYAEQSGTHNFRVQGTTSVARTYGLSELQMP
ncbi:hypothetical protein M0802_011508 [Mischocyttarus mexicanus]|nr:hypothetical protein M0802_011508 [Mischocyttarus mexicanus]